MIFTSVGYEVHLYDVNRQQVDQAMQWIQDTLKNFEEQKTLKGTLSAKQQFALVHSAYDLDSLLKDAIHCQVKNEKKTFQLNIIIFQSRPI